ncbi:MAG: DUF4249 domain-containing protein [Bacteroidia bacterium]|jgi:hypothetical protein|nr:DUF4249 domain-containing protein [Bacteroidia bacterium]
MRSFYLILLIVSIFVTQGCEKEITVDLPPGRKSLVVEASINPLFTNLNYVYITRTLDYFNPDLSSNGVKDALVYITPGTIVGFDTLYDQANRIQLFDIQTIPGVDSLLGGLSGIYFNPALQPEVGVPYLLEITAEGQEITGTTFIPKPVAFDTLYYRVEFDEADKDTDVFVTFEFTDPPEQNNYRLLGYVGQDALILGWGAANFSREFDDQLIGNGRRPYSFFSPFDYGDTLHLFLNNIGRKEYLFWESYDEAAGNGGPFATPIEVRSNITGAIGSFTGYGTSYFSIILR